MRKIDMHCHTTNRTVRDVVPKSASLEEIERNMKKYDVEKSVLLATYFPHRGSGISNFRLYTWIRDKPQFMMFGSFDFEHYFNQGLNELRELDDLKALKGIKIYTSYQHIDLHSNNFREIVGLARRNLLPVMFHCGYSYSTEKREGKKPQPDMVKTSEIEFLANENSELNFIASHMSKPFFDDLVETVKRNENIYSDMSGLLDSKNGRDEIPAAVDEVRRYLEVCGPKKLLFGTDFPVQTHEDSIYFVEEAMQKFSQKDKEDVYYNNARRILRI